MQSNFNKHFLFPNQLQSLEKKEETKAKNEVPVEPGSTSHRLQSWFSSARRGHPVCLVGVFYKLPDQEKSKPEAFPTNFNTLKSASNIKDKLGMYQLTTQEFVTKKVLSSLEIVCKLYLRNTSKLLRKQIESTRDKNIYFQVRPHVAKYHPMSATFDVSEYDAVENHIKFSSRMDFVLKTSKEDSIQSVVGCVQIFSGNSQTSMKAVGLTFYPLRITLLIFTEKSRRLKVAFGTTVVAYLPLSFHIDSDRNT